MVNINFRKKKIYGKIKLIMSSSSEVDVKLRIIDTGNNNEVIGDETTFTLFPEQTFGTTGAVMSFESSELSGSNAHQIQVHASSDTAGADIFHHLKESKLILVDNFSSIAKLVSFEIQARLMK